MDKNTKKENSLSRLGSDSAKTLIDQAKRKVRGFIDHFRKFEQQTVTSGCLKSTIFNRPRAVA